MKKLLLFVAVATLFFASCQKEIEPTASDAAATDQEDATIDDNHFTFKASIEALKDNNNPDAKGTLNASNQLVWKANDKIGIYFSNWNDNNNQAFTLSSGADTTEGDFSIDTGWSYNPNDATAAFYPWDDNDNSGDGTNNNVYDGYVYFTLHEGNYGYSSGKMLTPLVASLSNSTNIQFKHAGAAVKVTINNVPAHSKSIGMAVNGQQVSGSYSVRVANAGTDAIAVVGSADNTKNSVWLNYWNSSESEWTFIFPVPELTKPKLSFQMYDENNILVWSKNLKAQSSDLGRGDILVMPAIDITPYKQFNVSADWTFCGNINGCAWTDDIPMYTDGTVCILKGMSFKAGDEFKIRKNKAWDEAYPGSNYTITEDCTKDVWFNNSTHEITLKDAKCPYPAPKVTLYFGMNSTAGSSGAISCSGLGLYGWPSVTFTDKEYINGKCYFKYVTDAGNIWGKTVNDLYVFGNGASWVSSKSSADFTSIKTEYYFEVTSDELVEQLSARPADVTVTHTAISIDGDMSEWAGVEGTTVGNHTVKVESDATNLYVYSSRTNASGDYAAIWGGGGYVYVVLDLDNDSTTGSGDIYGNTGEFVGLLYPYAGSSASPAFNESPTSSWNASPSPYSVASVALKGVESSGTATIELSIPRANLPTLPSTPFTIKVWGNKGMSTVSLTHVL